MGAFVTIDGAPRPLRLTLGALAALEERLGGGDFEAMQRRLAAPRAADIIDILAALLEGAGAGVPRETLMRASIDAGEAARAIAGAFRVAGGDEGPAKKPVVGSPSPPGSPPESST